MSKSNVVKIAEVKSAQPEAKTLATNVDVNALGSLLPKAKRFSDPIFSRPFGKDGHTLADAIQHQAQVYRGLLRNRQAQLEKLKGIGEVLVELRSIAGVNNDRQLGELIGKTDLAIMSRQDRSDAMWLAMEWQKVQSFMKEMDISSGSASYLRKKVREAEAAKAAPQVQTAQEESKTPVQSAEKPADAKPAQPTETKSQKTAESVECPTPTETKSQPVANETIELVVDNEQAFAESMIQIAKAQGLDLAKIITAMLKAGK
jgi:hypothetical protein